MKPRVHAVKKKKNVQGSQFSKVRVNRRPNSQCEKATFYPQLRFNLVNCKIVWRMIFKNTPKYHLKHIHHWNNCILRYLFPLENADFYKYYLFHYISWTRVATFLNSSDSILKLSSESPDNCRHIMYCLFSMYTEMQRIRENWGSKETRCHSLKLWHTSNYNKMLSRLIYFYMGCL